MRTGRALAAAAEELAEAAMRLRRGESEVDREPPQEGEAATRQ